MIKIHVWICSFIFITISPQLFSSTEIPYFKDRVESGSLPPMSERLPTPPLQLNFKQENKLIGRYGGHLKLLMAKSKDTRQMSIYGYSRLIGYDQALQLNADILLSYEKKDARIYTLHLRPGHKWSDGMPFTTEDFRYFWEDIILNKDLHSGRIHKALLVDGELPKFEILDKLTVRYTWKRPNLYFIPALASASPLFIYKPAHYLKQFHINYTDPEKINALVKSAQLRNWAALHHGKDRPYKQINPDLPSLQPWTISTWPPTTRYVFKRNPYYHRTDPDGKQLPYIDEVVMQISSNKLVSAKTGSGDADLQARYLKLNDYTFLKQNEKNHNYSVRLWHSSLGAHLALFPNFNTSDETWRKLVYQRDFRRALSLGINRHEINQVVYYGLVKEGNNTVLPDCPLFSEDLTQLWASYEPELANQLLDKLGLQKRDDRGIRLLPDGRPMELTIHTAGESTEESDVLELIHDSWLKIGIKLYTAASQRDVFRSRIFSGEAVMVLWSGLLNALPDQQTPPTELSPNSAYQYQWPKWGQYYQSSGAKGEKPDIAAVLELVDLHDRWTRTTSDFGRKQIWLKILKIHRDELFTIGVINSVPQPVVVRNTLQNIPLKASYNLEPSAYFGAYHPDTFWFDNKN